MDAPGWFNDLFSLGPENHHVEENDDNFAGELEDLITSDDDQALHMDGQQNTFLDGTLRPEENGLIIIMDLDRQEDVLPEENCAGPVVLKLWQLDGDVKWCANKVWSCSSSSDCYNSELERPDPASTSKPLPDSMIAMVEQIRHSDESESCCKNSLAGSRKKLPSCLKVRLGQAKSRSNSRRPPTSKYKGVHRHVRSENVAAIWEAHCWNPFRSLKRMGNGDHGKNGAQEYLGQYVTEEEAARAHDKAALKLGLHLPENAKEGKVYSLNFAVEDYATDIAAHRDWSVSDYMWSFRRWASGFAKGESRFKGVSKKEAKWEARFGRTDKHEVKKECYLGLHEKEEEAAKAYDMAVLHFKGWDSHKLLTNFRPGSYDVQEVASFGKKLEEKNS